MKKVHPMTIDDIKAQAANIKIKLHAYEASLDPTDLQTLHNALNKAAVDLAGHLGLDSAALGGVVNVDGGTDKPPV
jgi:hypothetical protein